MNLEIQGIVKIDRDKLCKYTINKLKKMEIRYILSSLNFS